MATTGLSLHPDLLQPAGGGGILFHQGGGGVLVLAHLLQVALVSCTAFSEFWPTLVKCLGRGSAGIWLEPGHLGKVGEGQEVLLLDEIPASQTLE